MQGESSTLPLRPSFFDDDDLNITFQFVKPEKIHQKDLNQLPILKSLMVRKLPKSTTQYKGYFALHNRTLACYQNVNSKIPESVISLNFAKMKILDPSDENEEFGFSLSKNDQTYEFYSPEQPVILDWIEALKEVCVQSTFHEDFKALKMIGKGCFAKVYLVESKATGKMYAVKAFTKEGIFISNQKNAKPSMINEIDILKSLDHENIIKLYEVHETENSIYLVLEFVQGKTLQEVLRKSTFKDEFSEVKVLNMIRSILDALAYLSSKGIMHRDLKPDNILLDKDFKIKIADFGLATLVDLPEYIFKKCGTPGFIAPEVFKYDVKNPATTYDQRCDVFSAGCIFYNMLMNYPFFEGPNASEILRMNRKITNEFDGLFFIKQELKNPNSKISKDALNLLLQLLELEPSKRITASEALCHPYFIPVPNGMLKMDGSNDIVSRPLAKSLPSPLNLNLKKSGLSMALNSPTNSPLLGKETQTSRFAQKNSFFLDLGKPELNGKVDTIITNNSSNNNSVLMQRPSKSSLGSNSNSDSPSTFSKKNTFKRSRSMKIYNPMANSGQKILKAAILSNAAKNHSEIPETNVNANVNVNINLNGNGNATPTKIGGKPLKVERSNSDNMNNIDFYNESKSERSSPERELENSPTELRSPKAVIISKRRFQPFAPKSTKNAK